MSETPRLMVGGKEFNLKPLSLNNWIEAEELGLDMGRLKKGNSVKLSDMRTIVYVALKRAAPEDAEITLEWVGESLDLGDMDAFKVITNFIMPKVDGAETST